MFDLIMTRDEVKNPKPAPDMIIAACEALNIAKERALMLGDTDNDILAAQAAQIKSCLALWGYSNDMAELAKLSDHSAEHPMQVLHFITNNEKMNVKESISTDV